jgi:DNA-directed RNA polymerase subunit RPC12/RpoP
MRKYRYICIDCGTEFFSASHQALRCEKCRVTAKRKQKEEWKKKANKKHRIPRALPPRKSLMQVLRELEKYNKENGTYLSYGQYIAIIEKGEY